MDYPDYLCKMIIKTIYIKDIQHEQDITSRSDRLWYFN